MEIRDIIFRATAIMIFVQIVLGGLLTFNFTTLLPHIITGLVVLGFAITTMAIAVSRGHGSSLS